MLPELGAYVRAIKPAATILLVLAAGVVAVLAGWLGLDVSDRNAVATGAGVLVSILALLVALAIFRWTQSADARNHRELRSIPAEVVELLGPNLNKLIPLQGDSDEGDGPAEEAPDLLGKHFRHQGRPYVVARAGDSPAAWWARTLGIARDVAEEGGPHAPAAKDLLSLSLDDLLYTAMLDQRQRGNRRVLVVTNDQAGGMRVWSVYSGKGKHVEDVTQTVTH